jgi:amino acid transporter
MNKKLSVFNLSLITIGSVDSIRNLPAAAIAGSYLFHYFALALLLFLLPCAVISAWFSNQSNQGVFGWVKIGLGKNTAHMAVWFQCLQNVLLFPTLLSFIAGTVLHIVSPELVQNKTLLFSLILSMTLCLTWVNLKGMRFSSRVNTFCSINGLLLPFILIMLIGLYWWCTQTSPEGTVLPKAPSYSWTSLTAIMLSFCGVDLAAVHADESKPGAYAKSLIFSVSVIFFSMLFGSMVLAMIIAPAQLNYISSIPELIQLFFTKIHAASLGPFINGLVVLGCLGAANNWLIGPIKSLRFSAEEGFLKSKYSQLNAHNAPSSLLVIQALFICFISALFLVIPSINATYWIMINTATQIYLLMYALLFLSAIKVALNTERRIKIIVIFASVLGLSGIVTAFCVSFSLPPSFQISSQLLYALLSGLFLVFIAALPFLYTFFVPKKRMIFHR